MRFHVFQAGEILIVQKPEIGWSSYYPLLSGLITEVGQVSSHGALLAASYNLPCVVNVKQATKCFKTGMDDCDACFCCFSVLRLSLSP